MTPAAMPSMCAFVNRISPPGVLSPNVQRQARRAAGVTQKRTLSAVACTLMFGQAWPRSTGFALIVLSL
jgi:hypothetical protein